MTNATDTRTELRRKFGDCIQAEQQTRDGIDCFWVPAASLRDILWFLKKDIDHPYRMLYDLFAIDERCRNHRTGQPPADFTVVYQLLSHDRNADIRLKVPLSAGSSSIRTITDFWPSANWYECEAWDMFGISFEGHPHLRRILMPPTWQGHPLRKEHPARATEMPPFHLAPEDAHRELEALKFNPEAWGMKRSSQDSDFLFLNIGPNHPGTHGVFRLVCQLDGESIVDLVPDIGFHHRGKEKMAERQTWHTYIPYTDRVDYLGGVMNNLAYLVSVETLAGITVPLRAQVIRVMLAELFRISNHLVYYGTLAQDVGAMSPVFYMFTDREKLLDIISAVCGDRLHPNWFRIGGVAQDLPRGWENLIFDFVKMLPKRLAEYDRIVMRNPIFKKRTRGVGAYTADQAIEWGVTGPGLRACGIAWDYRKKRAYSGYDRFEFDVPVAHHGDCYDRAVIHIEEMRQSLRIIEQCAKNMPEGPYTALGPGAAPPVKEKTMHDIETLINHFLSVSWGPVIGPGEAGITIEGTKGAYGYHLVSDGATGPYRARIRTPSFPHLQMLPLLCRGAMLSDLIAILGALDFIMSDVDR